MVKAQFIQKTGRRKTSTARVRIIKGKGDILVNDKPADEYFSDIKDVSEKITAPLILVGQAGKHDLSVRVSGGGKKSQLESIVLGVARAIISQDESTRTTLKKEGFLTRDARVKERKKYGLKRARKAPQYRKR